MTEKQEKRTIIEKILNTVKPIPESARGIIRQSLEVDRQLVVLRLRLFSRPLPLLKEMLEIAPNYAR